MSEENTNVNETTAETAETKSYTDKELQSMIDKRVSQALETQRNKFENERKEAERLASMSAEEKMAEREKALVEREQQLVLAENRASALEVLAQKGIASSLVDLVIAPDAETMNERIKLLEGEFNNSVQAEIEKRLSGNTPTKAHSANGITREEFRKMSLIQQQNIYKTQPELYKSLTE